MDLSESFLQNNEAIKVPPELKSGKCGLDRTKIYFPESFTANDIKKNSEDLDDLSQPVAKNQFHQKNNADCYLIENANSTDHKTKERKTYSEHFEPKRSLKRVCQDSSIQSRLECQLFANITKTAVITNTLSFEGNKATQLRVDKDDRYNLHLNPFELYPNEKRFLSAKSAQITFQDEERTSFRREAAEEDNLFSNTDHAFRKENGSSYRITAEQNEVYYHETPCCSQIPLVRETSGCRKTIGVAELSHLSDGHRFFTPLSVSEKDFKRRDFEKTTKSMIHLGPSDAPTHNNAWKGPSYTELATQAILSTPDKKKTLAEIYDWMSENVQYFRERKHYASSQGWKVRQVL